MSFLETVQGVPPITWVRSAGNPCGDGKLYSVLLVDQPEDAQGSKRRSILSLEKEISVNYALIDGSYLSGDVLRGRLTKLSAGRADARLESSVPAIANLKLHVLDSKGGGRSCKSYSDAPNIGGQTSLTMNDRQAHFPPRLTPRPLKQPPRAKRSGTGLAFYIISEA